MTGSIRRCARPLSLGLTAVSAFFLLSVGAVYGDAVSHAPGRVRVPSGGDLRAGPGAVCAHAEVSREVDPAAGGSPCNDQTIIGIPGGITEPIISTDWTFNIGNAQTRAYGTPAPMGGGLPVGRSLQYVRTERNDKIGDARLMANRLTLTVNADKMNGTSRATANATQTIETPVGMAGKISGLATSSVRAGNPRRAAFGVAIVNDPILIEKSSLSEEGLVDVTIGNDTDLFKLQASDPGDFASAFYELGFGGEEPALSMSIGLDNTMTSLDQLDVEFFNYDPSVFGFPDATSFFDSQIEPFLNDIDPTTHLLTAKSEIPLFSEELGDAPFELTYNYAAVTGSFIPEPESVALFGLGVVALGFIGWRRYRREHAISEV